MLLLFLQVDNDEGVPLEHLVSCVRGVAIQQSASGVKQIIFVGITPPHQGFIGTAYPGRNEEVGFSFNTFPGQF